ncbi:MAG: ATP:cob(I)alamin adenosyltransferase [Candidatus Micrarchaeota archaeon]|nr:ATP:cob(I)alamin adenosyltransferase [Candidatus Micrarchaeota archaeon]
MITTKTGDKGETSLWGKRLKKAHPIFHALGALDEALSVLGELDLKEAQDKVKLALDRIALGQDISQEEIDALEKDIKLELRGFVRPKGKSAKIHVARAMVRRAERFAWESLDNNIPVYLNRLSDWLFVLAISKAQEWGELEYF